MGNLTNHKQIGGETVHVSDCCVWAEISYLDSPTDYREYLPQNSARLRGTPGNDLALEPRTSLPRSTAWHWAFWLAILSFSRSYGFCCAWSTIGRRTSDRVRFPLIPF